jgi:hypothetical protein
MSARAIHASGCREVFFMRKGIRLAQMNFSPWEYN